MGGEKDEIETWPYQDYRHSVWGDKTRGTGTSSYVNKEEILAALADDRLSSIELDLARPGESVRIMPVKDVIEPRLKVEGPGGIFPGFVSKVDMVGQGTTLVLSGAAVVTTGRIVGFQEGIIDMSGPGAEYTPFSRTCNLVVSCQPAPGLGQHEHEAAVRMAGLKAAATLPKRPVVRRWMRGRSTSASTWRKGSSAT